MPLYIIIFKMMKMKDAYSMYTHRPFDVYAYILAFFIEKYKFLYGSV